MLFKKTLEDEVISDLVQWGRETDYRYQLEDLIRMRVLRKDILVRAALGSTVAGAATWTLMKFIRVQESRAHLWSESRIVPVARRMLRFVPVHSTFSRAIWMTAAMYAGVKFALGPWRSRVILTLASSDTALGDITRELIRARDPMSPYLLEVDVEKIAEMLGLDPHAECKKERLIREDIAQVLQQVAQEKIEEAIKKADDEHVTRATELQEYDDNENDGPDPELFHSRLDPETGTYDYSHLIDEHIADLIAEDEITNDPTDSLAHVDELDHLDDSDPREVGGVDDEIHYQNPYDEEDEHRADDRLFSLGEYDYYHDDNEHDNDLSHTSHLVDSDEFLYTSSNNDYDDDIHHMYDDPDYDDEGEDEVRSRMYRKDDWDELEPTSDDGYDSYDYAPIRRRYSH